MRYRHQTINLKQGLSKSEREQAIGDLERELPKWQLTSHHWGKDEKTTTRGNYLVYPVESNFGIAVDLGEKPNDRNNIRRATIYPRLDMAVLHEERSTFREGPDKRTENALVRKLTKLGYKIAETRSRRKRKSSPYEPRPYQIVVEETRCFKSSLILETMITNINTIIGNRPEIESCNVVSFSPPGDDPGRLEWLTPPYGDPKLNLGVNWLVPVTDGRVDEKEISKIFNAIRSKSALGISSVSTPRRSAEQLASGDLFNIPDEIHTPMIDFRCATPEEAIHSIEKMGLSIKKSGVVLLDSGNSFHAHFPLAHGNEQASKNYLDLLGNHEDVCKNWVPIQKQQRYQLLRVSPCILKPKLPVILTL